MRSGWSEIGRDSGSTIPASSLEVSVFRHESCLCAFFQFPKVMFPGEAVAGMVVAGPFSQTNPAEITAAPVRYFLLEAAGGSVSLIKEWTLTGFAALSAGPPVGSDWTAFADMVFARLFGIRRPAAQDAARRLLILRWLVTYCQATPFGRALHSHPDVNAAAKADLHAIMGGMFSERLRSDNLWDFVSVSEKKFFETPVQNLTERELINVSWRSEAIHVLLWALGVIPQMLPYDKPARTEALAKLPAEGKEFISSAKLHEEKEIDHAREIAELWHWRSRTRQLQEAARPFEANEAMKKAGLNSYEDIIRITATTAAKGGDIPTCIADDFPVAGKAYRDLTAEEWSQVSSVSVERHFTLNWLCGHAPGNDWDRTPTDT